MGHPLPAALIARTRAVAEPRWSPDGRRLGWVEAFGGRADVVVAAGDGTGPPLVITGEVGAAAVGSYGGGVWCWAGSERVVVAAPDGRLLLVPVDGGPFRVLCDEGRAQAPAAGGAGMVAFVRETDDACDVAVVSLDGAAAPRTVSHADYAWDPAWAPGGERLAWHEWDLTGMSWDASRIVVAAPDGGSPRTVAGGEGVAVGQPRWSPDGTTLAFVSDRTGFWSVWAGDASGDNAEPLASGRDECAEPSWGPGQRSFAWSPDSGAVAVCRNEQGFGRLWVTTRGAEQRALRRGWHHGLDWQGGGIVAVRSGARTPPEVTVLDPAAGAHRVVARGAPAGFEAAGLIEPEPVEFAGRDGTPRFGLVYRPAHSALGPRMSPPVLLDVHGGPTGQSCVQWKPFHQYFVSRGWAVLAPDPRGSTGHGRAYVQALAGAWGDADVEDCASAIDAIGPRGWGDPARVAACGGSAGALTALGLAARAPARLRAVVSLYGVSDLAELAATTHRFESRYLDRLVGELPRDAARYRERSPVTHAGEIRVPTLVLHGDADKVVPPAQAAALVDAIRAAGGTVETRVFEGEGHGWSREDTILEVYARVEDFLRRAVLEDP